MSGHLPLDFYDIGLKKDDEFSLDVDINKSISLFSLKGDIELGEKKLMKKLLLSYQREIG